MNLINIKSSLQKNFWGRILIKCYHCLYSVPTSYLMLLKYRLFNKSRIEVKFYTTEELFDMLIVQHKSLTRFGDGEIAWIYKDAKGYFGQENSDELSRSLKKVLISERESLLIGIPDFFDGMETYSEERKRNREIHLSKYQEKWRPLINTNRKYVDALITRVYNGRVNIDYAGLFNQWKQVWNNKKLYVIEGAETKFGVGNDLLSNASMVKRIVCPAENAFSKYDEILNEAKKHTDAELFLIALGPTASILAYDLDCLGYQAIDIGHLDIEYEWYLKGANTKTPVVGKYVNEAGGAPLLQMEPGILLKYESEITSKILL